MATSQDPFRSGIGGLGPSPVPPDRYRKPRPPDEMCEDEDSDPIADKQRHLRQVLLNCFTDDHVRHIYACLKAKAETGDEGAIKLYLDYAGVARKFGIGA